MRRIFSFFILSTVLLSCNEQNKSNTKAPGDVLALALDTTTKPGDDFFMYANGGWIKANPIPGEQSSWGIGNVVVEENLKRLRTIAEDAAAKNADKGSTEQKIGNFWKMAMDSAKIEKDGLSPLKPMLTKIDSITDVNSLINVTAEMKRKGSSTMFSNYVTQDDKKSDEMAYRLGQGGLGLGEREYYFKTDSATKNIRNEYLKYITQILTLSGYEPQQATTAANNILTLETKLAQASRKLEDLRDPYRNYNKMAIADLGKLNMPMDWKAFFQQMGVKNIDSVIVGQPEFFTALGGNLKTTSIADWKSYLRFNLINDFSGALPDTFVKAAFNFNKLFSGAKQMRPRWKRSISSMENVMGEALGKLYVKEFFNETAKKRYENMVQAIKDALKLRIQNLTWMGDSTKQKAYAKLASIKQKVGYPDKWKDFSTLEIGTESYVQNLMNANEWWHNYNINKLGKPVDRDEWDMYPQTYNAYYNPSNNEIVLPAGIFTVPGYRDEELDDATVFGYAGASTIGHEITHGFDDEGRKFDEKGNLVSWWTAKDETEFNKRADVMIKQFDGYEPLAGYHINGKATLGENIADLGGILLGLEAFKKTQQFKDNKSIAGLTPLQRYFLGYALGWQSHQRDERLRRQLLTDVHSPANYRVNGPFVSVDDFYTAFNIKSTDKMYRPDSLRVKIW